jgi:hypothetical protein
LFRIGNGGLKPALLKPPGVGRARPSVGVRLNIIPYQEWRAEARLRRRVLLVPITPSIVRTRRGPAAAPAL